MYRRTSPSMLRRPSAFIAGAALLGTCALTAIPAQAATLEDKDSPSSAYFSRVATPRAVTMEYTSEGGSTSPIFPAGTYWVAENWYTNYFPFWVPGLSETYETDVTDWTRVILWSPGPIKVAFTTGMEADMATYMAVWRMDDGAPDPRTLTDDEITAYLTDDAGNPIEPEDDALVTAANIGSVATDPFWDVPEAPEMVMGDFYNIGTSVPATRVGNLITIYGPNGAKHSFRFGRPTDMLLVGDWNGDGKDTIGIRRGNLLFLDDDLDGGWAEYTYTFGRAGDEVMVGDWDGDDKDTVSVRRGNTFYFTNDFKGGWAPTDFSYGRATDDIYVADWNQDGKDSFAALRGQTLYVKNTLTSGVADAEYTIALD